MTSFAPRPIQTLRSRSLNVFKSNSTPRAFQIPLTSIAPLPLRPYTSHPPHDSEEALAAARKWLSKFTPASIPRHDCIISFSRSSGPGGQNVNKTNSKVTLRLPLSRVSDFIPSLVLSKIKHDPNMRRFITTGDEIVIQSDRHRHQQENEEDCYVKLHRAIVEAADLPGETTEEQKHRVQKLVKNENEARLRTKKFKSSKKAGRRDKGDF